MVFCTYSIFPTSLAYLSSDRHKNLLSMSQLLIFDYAYLAKINGVTPFISVYANRIIYLLVLKNKNMIRFLSLKRYFNWQIQKLDT